MAPLELVHRYPFAVVATNGTPYAVRAYAAPGDTTWDGWLVFFPCDGGPALPTDRETTQPNLDAMRYWASGLEPVYLEGALARALALRSTRSAWASP